MNEVFLKTRELGEAILKSEEFALAVPDSAGVYIVPKPWASIWKPRAKWIK